MRTPDRVLMTCDTLGGVWTYALELCRGLGQRGVEVVLASTGRAPDAAQRAAAAALPHVTLVSCTGRLEWMRDPWEDLARTGEWLLELCAAYRPDVVHLNEYAHGTLPWDVPVVMVGHSCVWSWYAAVRGRLPGREWNLYRARVGAGLVGADWLVAPTRAMLAALACHYGPPRRARVIPNGRAATEFPPEAKEPLVLSAGRLWDEAKNVGALAAAAPHLPWPVYVAGPRHHPDDERAQQEELAGVRTLGNLASPELAAWMGRASIYALPARYEPFGLSPLEAALAGCALVLGEVPSLREVWGEAALWVDPDDPQQLAGALRGLIEDTRARLRLAQAARRRALSFTPARMTSAYLDCYRTLLGERARATVTPAPAARGLRARP